MLMSVLILLLLAGSTVSSRHESSTRLAPLADFAIRPLRQRCTPCVRHCYIQQGMSTLPLHEDYACPIFALPAHPSRESMRSNGSLCCAKHNLAVSNGWMKSLPS